MTRVSGWVTVTDPTDTVVIRSPRDQQGRARVQFCSDTVDVCLDGRIEDLMSLLHDTGRRLADLHVHTHLPHPEGD